jgi:chromosome segregation ATPase
MPATHKPKPHLIGNRVASAKSRTEKVQEDIHLAEAELHLAHTVISEKLADGASDADLAKAVTHTEQVEAKLQDAHDDLQVVADLLTSEERDRKRLEAALEELRAAETPSSAGSRSGSGSASVIEHLRELTRHKVSVDHAEPGRHDLPHTPPAA